MATEAQLRAAHENGKNGGRPPGKKSPRTLEKEKIRREVANQIMRKARPLVRAGMTVALGQQFVYRIDEEKDADGKTTKREHVLVTDPEEIANALDQIHGKGVGGDNDEYYYITTKEPNYKAIEMLMNRALDKPKEMIGLDVQHTFSLTGLAKKRDEMIDGNANATVLDAPVLKEMLALDETVIVEANET